MSERETADERVNRELIELLNELRVALPGVQVMFAFLLLLPFQQAFAQLTAVERALYLVAFASATAASVCLIAPSTYHRIRFRDGDKEQLLRTSNVLLLAGTAFLGLAIVAVAFLVTDVVVGEAAGAVAAFSIALVISWLWFGLPVWRKTRDGQSNRSSDE